jgi:alkaline phosphatase D
MAIALGATAAWGQPFGTRSNISWRERRYLFPEGVASGDPERDSVILWTRRPPKDGTTVKKVTVDVAEDQSFTPFWLVRKRLSRKPRTGPAECWLAD